MTEQLTDQDRARAALAALDVLEAAATGGSQEHSVRVAREMAGVVFEDLTPAQCASAAATLAVMAAYGIPQPVKSGQLVMRLARLRAWVPGVRVQWTWDAS